MKITDIPKVIQDALEVNGIKAGVVSVNTTQDVDRGIRMEIELIVEEELDPPIPETKWEKFIKHHIKK